MPRSDLTAARTTVRANGVDLCVETFGDPEDSATLLVAGALCSMDWWEDEFCERLAGGSRFVVRYDHRDTGESTSYEAGAPPYSGLDLAADALGLLDALGIARAHLVGLSMGGGICQLLAHEHPERVASLTLVSTSPIGRDTPELPPMSAELASFYADASPPPDWTDRAAVVEYIVEGERPLVGSFPFDEAAVRAIAERVVERTVDIQASLTNHVLLGRGESSEVRIGDITAPTLVLHGTEDPLFPFAHGEALAAAIPGARLLPLQGMGHEYPPRALWGQVVGTILELTAQAEA